ncbi:trypsin-like serine protease [Pirellulaceae bacterium SH449]
MQQNTAKETSGQSTSKTHGESPALPSHLSDDMLNASLPTRTWGEFLGETSRKLGLGSALLGAGLGLSGIAPSGMEKRAEGGIIISGGDDQQARDNGVAFSVFGGGNTGFLQMVSSTRVMHSSVVFINDRTAIAAAHQVFNPEWGSDQLYFVGTSPNFNEPSLGSVHQASRIIVHPTWNGSYATGIDLAVIQFDSPVAGVNPIVFADSRPFVGDTVWFSGYGITGDTVRGYVGQDGFIRAGTSIVQSTAPLLGGDPMFYLNARYRNFDSFPTDMRPAGGDSGGGAWTPDGALWGLIVAGDLEVFGNRSMSLDLNAPGVRSFISENTVAVPEPGTLALLVSAGGAFAAWRRIRRRLDAKLNSGDSSPKSTEL